MDVFLFILILLIVCGLFGGIFISPPLFLILILAFVVAVVWRHAPK